MTRDNTGAPPTQAPDQQPTRDARQGEGQGAPATPSAEQMQGMIVDALLAMKPNDLSVLLQRAGVVPQQAFTPDSLVAMANAFAKNSAEAVRETLRQERPENPSYPEKSVFFPRGKFDDKGHANAPKIAFRRPTFFNNVHLKGELETEEEIALFNGFTEDRTAREGRWKATIFNKGTKFERLLVEIPSKTTDDRMDNSLPLPLILLELQGGAEAVNPTTLQARIDALQARVDELEALRRADAAPRQKRAS